MKLKKIFNHVFFVILISLIINDVCNAEPVSLETAKQVAFNFFSERITKRGQDYIIEDNYTITEDSDAIFYIYNFKPSGFVIVSADDVTIPIIGYSYEYSYSNENHPPQFQAMIECYKDVIVSARINNLSRSKKSTREWERLNKKPNQFIKSPLTGNVEPLIQSTWDQYFPYNELCPGGSLVGCVAIAMGQVMKYWSNPEHGKGSHTYYHYNYGYLSANFDTTYYQWQQIPHDTSESNIPAATLLYHCGVSVDMNYSTSGSGATLDGYDGALQALETYFRYDTDAFFGTRTEYGDSLWQVMIRNEIENYRPVIYGGWDSWTWGGHAWNLDGYEQVGDLYHYHMNWGWSGSYNGYYYLDDLTPGYSHDYTLGQEAILNLYPYAAEHVSCYPHSSNFWTGTTTPSAKTQTSLVHAVNDEDGWMLFDNSSIPDGATIYAVIFNGYVYDRYKPDWSITPVTSNPLTAAPSVLHPDIVTEQDSGFYFTLNESYVNYVEDWRTYMLEGNVNSDFETSLALNQFCLGIANKKASYYNIKFDGWDETHVPFLEVYYAAFGNIEGYVTEYGSKLPLENVIITIGSFSDTADVNGYYSIDDVPIGVYDVVADANNNSNSNGNPYFDETANDVSIYDSSTIQQDFSLKWAEIEVSPAVINEYVYPDDLIVKIITITNNGPGNLLYSCHVEPIDPIGSEIAIEFDVSTPANDNLCRGCEFDGTYIWVTGDYGDPKLYKFDTNGNLLATYQQCPTYSGIWGLVFHDSYLYGGADHKFFQIDPTTGSCDTLFVDDEHVLGDFEAITYVPSLGFVSSDEDEDFVIFDLSGTKLGTLCNTEEKYIYGLAYDETNDCLWIFTRDGNPYTTRLHQYDFNLQEYTEFNYPLDLLTGLSFQTAGGICFTDELIDGKPTICGIVQGNPVDKFFVLELDDWLSITTNSFASVPGYAKGTKNIDIQLDASNLIYESKTSHIVFLNNAGANDTVSVTITNNYTHGDVEGYITEYGSKNAIENATVTIIGTSYSDVTDYTGFYHIENIPLGKYKTYISADNYLDSTVVEIPITGITYALDVGLKWSEINVTPSSFNETVNPNFPVEKDMIIRNNGPGELIYNCNVEYISGFEEPSILVVDRDFSCFIEPKVTSSKANDDVWPIYQAALDSNGYSYTYYEVSAPWDPSPDSTFMFNYNIIIWFTGETGSYDCLTYEDEDNLGAFLNNGGSLFLSSMNYLNKFSWNEVVFSEGEFPYDYLGLRQANIDVWDFWNTGTIEGADNSLAEYIVCNVHTTFFYSGLIPDEITEHIGQDLFYVTSPSPEGLCAIQYNSGSNKTVFSTNPFSSIVSGSCRTQLMEKIITYLSKGWLTISENISGTVPGYSKNSINLPILFDASGLTESTVQANIVINNNAYYPQTKGDDYMVPITMTVDTSLPPESPENIIIQINGNDVILTWDIVTGASCYHIYRSNNPSSNYTELPSSPVSINSFTDTGAADSHEKLFYYITADNTKGSIIKKSTKVFQYPSHRMNN